MNTNLNTTFLDTTLLDASRIVDLIPKPSLEKLAGGRYGIKTVIQRNAIMYTCQSVNNYIADNWRYLYTSAINFVAATYTGLQEYAAFKLTAVTRPILDECDSIELALIVDMFIIPTQEFRIPIFRYACIDQEYRAVEWRCGYCGLPNNMNATYCGEFHKHAAGCGHPRAKLLQEFS